MPNFELTDFTNDQKVISCLHRLIRTNRNIIVSGQAKTGKTSLQKALVALIPNQKRLLALDDRTDLQLDQLYPKKDIIAWHVGDYLKTPIYQELDVLKRQYAIIHDLIKRALQLDSKWLIFSELRGQDTIHVLNAIESGLVVITTTNAGLGVNLADKLTMLATMNPDNELSPDLIKRDLLQFDVLNVHLSQNHQIDEISKLVSNETDNKEILYQNY